MVRPLLFPKQYAVLSLSASLGFQTMDICHHIVFHINLDPVFYSADLTDIFRYFLNLHSDYPPSCPCHSHHESAIHELHSPLGEHASMLPSLTFMILYDRADA